MPYCDVIDDAARAIGSVNTIVNKNGRLEGHNTDFARLGNYVPEVAVFNGPYMLESMDDAF